MYDINTEKKDNMCITQMLDKSSNIKICECKISVTNQNVWTISSWYTTEGYKHKGYGKITLQACVDYLKTILDLPIRIEYIWNGANEYVFDWLNTNFGAISRCPIAVQKYASDDDWESHIYVLNREKFLRYFNLV